jgi:hypothetical protein
VKERLKQKLVDLGLLIIAVAVVVAGVSIYNRLEAHNKLVEALVDLVKQQQSQQIPEGGQ